MTSARRVAAGLFLQTVYGSEFAETLEDDYAAAVEAVYGPDFAEFLAAHDTQAEQMFGGTPHVTRVGSTYLKYLESPTRVVLLGLVTPQGRMSVSDGRALLGWMDRLRDALEHGKEVLASVNDRSWPILQRVVDSGGFSVEKLYQNRMPQGTWTTLRVTR